MNPFTAGMMTPRQYAEALNAELAQERNQYYQKWVNAENLLDEKEDALEKAKNANAEWAKYAKELRAESDERGQVIAELIEEKEDYRNKGIEYRKQIREQNAKIEVLETKVAALEAA